MGSLLKLVGLKIAAVVAAEAFEGFMTYEEWELRARMKENLTRYLMKAYFHGNLFYTLKNIDGRIADPEQRIADDVRDLCQTFAELVTGLIKPMAEITVFGAQLHGLLGAKNMAYVYLYLIAGVAFVRLFMPDYKKFEEKQKELEGKLKFVHSRTRTNAESIAFFGGDDVEYGIAERRAEKLFDLSRIKYGKDWMFGVPNMFLFEKVPESVNHIMRFRFQDHVGTKLT